MMLRTRNWIIILYVLQLFHLLCRGNSWDQSLRLFQETSLDYIAPDLQPIFIEDLQVIVASTNALTISWNPSNQSFTTYLIEWYDFTDELSVRRISKNFSMSDNFVFTIESLEPCSTYNITVTAETNFEIEATGESVIGETVVQEPSAPLHVTADSLNIYGTLMLRVSWKKPEVASACVLYYTVKISVELHFNIIDRQNTMFTYVTFTNVWACTSYQVRVQVIDRNSVKGSMTRFQAEPTVTQISEAPKLSDYKNLKPIKTTETSISILWSIRPDHRNNCSLITVLSECFYDDTAGYGYNVTMYQSGEKSVKGQNLMGINVVINNLSPFTNYSCVGYITNAAGKSFGKALEPIRTREDVPSAPENLRYVENTHLTVQWEPPKLMPGELKKYRLTLVWEPLSPVPDYCNNSRKAVLTDISRTANSYTWKGGEGYSKYTAFMDAMTNAGWGLESQRITFNTAPVPNVVPSEVTNLRFRVKISSNNPKAFEANLSWNLPCSLNGRLKYFRAWAFGWRQNFKNHTLQKFMPIRNFEDLKRDEKFSTNLEGLRPEYNYEFKVVAAVRESREEGNVAKLIGKYPAGTPPQPSNIYVKKLRSIPSKGSLTSAEILLPLFSDANGDIQSYAILVSKLGFMSQPSSGVFDNESDRWPTAATWKDAMQKDFEVTYQGSAPGWSPHPSHIVNYGDFTAIKFVVGEDITCKYASIQPERKLYCNGPLKPGNWYEIRIRAFTKGGYTDSMKFIRKTDAESSVDELVILVVGIVLVGIVAAPCTLKYVTRYLEIAMRQGNVYLRN